MSGTPSRHTQKSSSAHHDTLQSDAQNEDMRKIMEKQHTETTKDPQHEQRTKQNTGNEQMRVVGVTAGMATSSEDTRPQDDASETRISEETEARTRLLKNLDAILDKLGDSHGNINDCYRSLVYLEKCFDVSTETQMLF